MLEPRIMVPHLGSNRSSIDYRRPEPGTSPSPRIIQEGIFLSKN